jgi:hypothetical protein
MTALLGLFLNPLFLLAVPTAGIPVVLHLLHRRKAPVLRFSTLRFLKISHEKTARRKKIYDRLLLVLRMLLFALLAVALAQPFLRSGATAFGGRAATAVCLVLDRSYSMGTRHGGVTRLTQAKQAAETVLEGLGDQDAAYVIGTPSRAEGPASQPDVRSAREAVRQMSLSSGHADLAASLARAYEQLRNSDRPNREIYVLTDSQKVSWGAFRSAAEHFDPAVPVVVVQCGQGPVPNFSIQDLKVRGKRRVVGVPVTLEARVKNHSPQRAKRIISLYVDRQKEQEQTIDVPGDAESVVLFEHVFRAEGLHAGWAMLPDDALPADNQRFFQVRIQARLPVLLIKDRSSAVGILDPSFYVERALNPYQVLGEPERSIIQADPVAMEEVTEDRLRQASVVFLVNCRAVPSPQADWLAEFVTRGGGVVAFPDDDLDSSSWNAFLQRGDPKPILPVQLSRPEGLAADAEPLRVQEPDLSFPVFQPFREESRHLFRQWRIQRFIPAEVLDPVRTRTLLRLTNGRPLLLTGEAGNGAIFLWTLPVSSQASNLPVNNLFLPLMHQMVYTLSKSEDRRLDFTVGRPARITFDARVPADSIDVVVPSGRRFPMKVTMGTETCAGTFDETEEPGIYEGTLPGAERPEVNFTVNVDPAESGSETMAEDEWKQQVPATSLWVVQGPDRIGEIIRRMREGVQLWNLFLAVVLILALTECLVANRQGLSTLYREPPAGKSP